MSPARALDPSDEIGALRAEIAEHDHRYHVLDDPSISDADYDALVRRLRRLEDDNPDLVTADSPTQRVGAALSTAFAPVVHQSPMMSLDNAFASTSWWRGASGWVVGRPMCRRSCAS